MDVYGEGGTSVLHITHEWAGGVPIATEFDFQMNK